MNVFKLQYTAERISGGEKKVEKREKCIELPSHPSEITMLQWVRYHKLRLSAPQIVKDIEVGGKIIKAIGPQQWVDYMNFCARAIAIFCQEPVEDILVGANADAGAKDGIISMYTSVVSPLLSYIPQDRQIFFWKRRRFTLPETVKQSFGSVLVGGRMSVADAVDALQIEHILGVSQDGEELIEDQKYHNDIMLVAALCREVYPDGSIEAPPTDFIDRRQWLDDRAELFKDLTMDIALDVGFFLITSKIALLNTLSSALRLKAELTLQLTEKERKKQKRSGKHGDGKTSTKP